jgi:hypothetical protein
MITELEARYYAFHTFYYAFYDETIVMNSVLRDIDSANLIYHDPNFGLDSSRKMYIWV